MLPLIMIAGSIVTGAPSQSFLTPKESVQLVQEIDGICHDSWCRGDLNYLFDQLECGPQACFFDVRAEIRPTDSDGESASRESRPFRCELKGFASRSDLVNESGTKLTYSSRLYEAVGTCLLHELSSAHPIVYFPDVKSCRASIEQQPFLAGSAHSTQAEAFYELEDPVEAAAQTLNDMITAYSRSDSSCRLTYDMAFRDQVPCLSLNAKALCSFPGSEGQFLLIKDDVDSAAVLYFKGRTKSGSVLGLAGANPLSAQLVDSSLCYTELLNLNGTQAAAKPQASFDHRSYFMSTKNLRSTDDARLNASLLVNEVVRNLGRAAEETCEYQEKTVTLDSTTCQKIGDRDVCLLSNENIGGYFIVSKDNASGAFVTFVRFD